MHHRPGDYCEGDDGEGCGREQYDTAGQRAAQVVMVRPNRLRPVLARTLACRIRETKGMRVEVDERIEASGRMGSARETCNDQEERKHVTETDGQSRPA